MVDPNTKSKNSNDINHAVGCPRGGTIEVKLGDVSQVHNNKNEQAIVQSAF
jgi:hypothetical protein